MTARLSDPIEFVMSKPVAFVPAGTTVRDAARCLRDDQVGALAVTDDGTLIGILSERDVARAIADGVDPDLVWVDDIIAGDLVVASPEDAVIDCVLLMATAGVRHLPIAVDGTVVGMFSLRDGIDAVLGDAAARLDL